MKHRGIQSQGPPPQGSWVTIHYNLWFEGQDESYDSTFVRGIPEKYKINDGRLLPGLEEAIATMKLKEKARFLIQPDYAFGEFGCPPRIPPNAEIMADVELIGFVEEDEAEEMLLRLKSEETKKSVSFKEIDRVVSQEREQGNEADRLDSFKDALKKYNTAIQLLEFMELNGEEEEKRQKSQLLKCYLNRGQCSLKLAHPNKACVDLQKALNIDPQSAKANFRLGLAKSQLGNNKDALKYLRRAQRIRPQDTNIAMTIENIEKKIRDAKDAERAFCAKAFGNMSIIPGNEVMEVDDEFFEDVHGHFKGYKESGDVDDLALPCDWNEAEIQVAKSIAEELGLGFKTQGGKNFVFKKQV